MKMFRAAHHWVLLLASLIVLVAFDARPVGAASMYVYLLLDPATTAGAGVPTIPSGNVNLSVTSGRSGPGTFHLYVVDDVAGSFGIRNYSISITGASSISHRSPVGNWDDNVTFGDGSGPFSVGFNDLRSGANVTPIVAGQGVVNNPQIGGLGITASNFGAKIGAAAQSYSGVTSGQWGNYSAANGFTSGIMNFGAGASGQPRNALFIADGQYTGSAPTVTAASISYWTNAQLTSSVFAPSYLLNTNPFIPEPTALSLLGIGIAIVGGVSRLGISRGLLLLRKTL